MGGIKTWKIITTARKSVKAASFGAWIRIILTKESVRTSQVSGLGKKEVNNPPLRLKS